MKIMQMNNEYKAVIESIIKENPKYKENLDLKDLIIEEIYKRSYLLIDAIKDVERLKRHLEPICETCLDKIIGEKLKYKTSNDVVINIRPPKPPKKDEIISLKQPIPIPVKAEEEDILIDPIAFSQKREIGINTIEKLIQIVKQIDTKNPKKGYYRIFFLRYLKGLNQAEISREMKLSQMELSKRFVELIKLTREKI